MAEYIERDMFLKIISHKPSSPTTDREDRLINYCISAVKNFPAADVRPVVLCKDCKYWFNAPAADGFNSCEQDALIRHKNFFCAAGEKREES